MQYTPKSLNCTLYMAKFREGTGTPPQYSCLENPMDGGAWWATAHGVAKSRTRLSDFTSLPQTRRGLTLLSQLCRDPAVGVRNAGEA